MTFMCISFHQFGICTIRYKIKSNYKIMPICRRNVLQQKIKSKTNPAVN